MSKKLYIPGPVEVSADVLEAMATPMIGHRMKEYAVLHKEVTDGLKKLLNAPGPVFLATSSAFGVMEGAVRNLVQKRCACFANGAFSKKWYDVTLRCGLEADLFSADWGQPVTAEMVDAALASGKYDAMTLVHNETSTGVMSPLEEIAEVMQKYPEVSFIVDTVSSMTAVPLDVTALGIDVCLAGVQKAFAIPPGLAVFSVSRKALDKARTTPNRGYYFDFEEFEKNDEKKQYPQHPLHQPDFRPAPSTAKDVRRRAGKTLRPSSPNGRCHPRLGSQARLWSVRRRGRPLPDPYRGYQRRQHRCDPSQGTTWRARLCHGRRLRQNQK